METSVCDGPVRRRAQGKVYVSKVSTRKSHRARSKDATGSAARMVEAEEFDGAFRDVREGAQVAQNNTVGGSPGATCTGKLSDRTLEAKESPRGLGTSFRDKH